ncbi:universal stress protein [Streptomyces sp. NPDC048717]|uniref:universal stress protein n=1 Tax=unclassified Streptomyces TaxID=2593676 RepID=UPI0033C27038
MAGGRIVVGVDGSAPSLRALKWAARQAAATGDTVQAVISWEYPASWATLMPGVPPGFDPQHLAEQILDETVSQALPADQAAAVTLTVVGGNPSQALIDAAKDADLLVVGDRGRSGFKAAVLGSVSSNVAQHAPCPVVVVRGSIPGIPDEVEEDGKK